MSLLLENIRKTYRQPEGGRLPVLGIDQFQLQRGEQAALIGSSGGGKTTLLNVISGITLPDSGSVLIDNIDLARLHEVRRDRFRAQKIGFVFQSFNLLPRTTALRQVTLPLLYASPKPSNADAMARRRLEQVGLADRLDHHPRQLSGGQQQRLCIARAVAMEPDVLLLDEPTNHLDMDAISALIVALNNYQGGLIIVSHDQYFVSNVCSQIYYIKQNRVKRFAGDFFEYRKALSTNRL